MTTTRGRRTRLVFTLPRLPFTSATCNAKVLDTCTSMVITMLLATLTVCIQAPRLWRKPLKLSAFSGKENRRKAVCTTKNLPRMAMRQSHASSSKAQGGPQAQLNTLEATGGCCSMTPHASGPLCSVTAAVAIRCEPGEPLELKKKVFLSTHLPTGILRAPFPSFRSPPRSRTRGQAQSSSLDGRVRAEHAADVQAP